MSQMNNNIQNLPQYYEAQPKKPSVEDLLESFMEKINKKIESNGQVLKMRIEENEKKLNTTETLLLKQSDSIKKLKIQMSQIHTLLTQRSIGTLQSETKKSPREEAKAITLRSGKHYEEPKEDE